MTITFVPEVEGYLAHWEVIQPDMTQLLTEQFENRTGLFISVIAAPGTMADQDIIHDGMVVIVLPLGKWDLELSYDGKQWIPVSGVESKGNGIRINYHLNGSPFPRWWGRYTKQLE